MPLWSRQQREREASDSLRAIAVDLLHALGTLLEEGNEGGEGFDEGPQAGHHLGAGTLVVAHGGRLGYEVLARGEDVLGKARLHGAGFGLKMGTCLSLSLSFRNFVCACLLVSVRKCTEREWGGIRRKKKKKRMGEEGG